MATTQQNKREYFKRLREEWKRSKELAEQDQEAKAIYREHGLKVSYTNFYIALNTMRALGWEGIPYVHCKTFKRWKEAGYVVKKDEKSKIKGITWIHPTYTDPETGEVQEDLDSVFPKVFHLFHESQVTEIH